MFQTGAIHPGTQNKVPTLVERAWPGLAEESQSGDRSRSLYQQQGPCCPGPWPCPCSLWRLSCPLGRRASHGVFGPVLPSVSSVTQTS